MLLPVYCSSYCIEAIEPPGGIVPGFRLNGSVTSASAICGAARLRNESSREGERTRIRKQLLMFRTSTWRNLNSVRCRGLGIRCSLLALLFAALSLWISHPCIAVAQTVYPNWEYEGWGAIKSREVFRGKDRYRGAVANVGGESAVNLLKRTQLFTQLEINLPLAGRQNGREFTEFRAAAGYETWAGPLRLRLGLNRFFFAGEGDIDPLLTDTSEIYAYLIFDSVLEPAVYWSSDLDQFGSEYHEFSLKHTFEMGSYEEELPLTPFVRFGYSNEPEEQYLSSGLNHIAYGAYLDFQSGDIRITPAVTRIERHDGAVASAWIAGITVRATF